MDPERALTVALLAFVAGSVTLFLTLTVIGALTDGADLLRFGAAGVLGVVVAIAVGLRVHRRVDDERLTGP